MDEFLAAVLGIEAAPEPEAELGPGEGPDMDLGPRMSHEIREPTLEDAIRDGLLDGGGTGNPWTRVIG